MYVWILLFLAYCAITWYSLIQASSPSLPCGAAGSQACYRPLVSTGDHLTIQLWLYQPVNETKKIQWQPVDTCHISFTIPNTGTLPKHLTSNGTLCEVPLPNSARRRSSNAKAVKPLKARFLVRLENGQAVTTVPFDLTRVNERQPGMFWTTSTSSKTTAARNLLQEPLPSDSNNKTKEPEGIMYIPYLKYGRSPVRLRFVAESREYGILSRADGWKLNAWNHSMYAPLMYVDDLSLQHSSQVELGPPEDNKPPIKLHIKIGSVSPVVDALIQQSQGAFESLESMMPGEELDEIRYFLQDERLYRFVLTQIISFVHMWVDYLAFRDEITFYRGRQNLSGVSTSTAITRLICSVIILLYLLDGGGTSWVILLSLISSCSIDAWKVWKLLQPRFTRSFPFVAVRQLQTAKEQQTAEYDRIATKNLAMILYPLVIGWSLYALQHYEYKSWYSWLISNLANAVYTFGFISLCPQLYVNYRLKSVSHLPWKVFIYKIFNTFVDDAFAWLIDMPWKHRIMTLRDDVVFILLLVQVYIYRVDKTRTNEFGYSYEEEKEDQQVKDKEE
jgi:hypothetical protein